MGGEGEASQVRAFVLQAPSGPRPLGWLPSPLWCLLHTIIPSGFLKPPSLLAPSGPGVRRAPCYCKAQAQVIVSVHQSVFPHPLK